MSSRQIGKLPTPLSGGSGYSVRVTQEAFELVRLANGAASVRYADYGETLHPIAGPAAEAESLYVRQLRLPERMRAAAREFVVWDVGMGIAANVLTVARALAGCPGTLRLVSFDNSVEPLRFALARMAELPHLRGFEPAVADLLAHGRSRFNSGSLTVEWSLVNDDFPKASAERPIGNPPAPDAILFDPFSPAVNPAMWTLGVFQNLFARLDSQRACNLATYSRTTFVRVSLLLAGFFVGVGECVAGKEETTVAANDPKLIARPLDRRWLERARRSHSAEPLREPVHRQAPLTVETWERLKAHPQFR
jgi:tRNA U34 5-methylaminomethyl-2-thiouridine-forming methyltransferase MnmC